MIRRIRETADEKNVLSRGSRGSPSALFLSATSIPPPPLRHPHSSSIHNISHESPGRGSIPLIPSAGCATGEHQNFKETIVPSEILCPHACFQLLIEEITYSLFFVKDFLISFFSVCPSLLRLLLFYY